MRWWERGIRIVRFGLLSLAGICLVLHAAGYRGVWWVSPSGNAVGVLHGTLELRYCEPGALPGSVRAGWRLGNLSGISVRVSSPTGESRFRAESWLVGIFGGYGPAGASPWLHFLTIDVFPLRVAIAAGALGAGLLVVPTRRRRAGACDACGYNRSGLSASALCPECGTAPAPVSALAQ